MSIYAYVHMSAGVHRGQNREWEPLVLQLQEVLSLMWVLGTKPLFCVRIVQDCNCRVFPPAPSILCTFLVRFVLKY